MKNLKPAFVDDGSLCCVCRACDVSCWMTRMKGRTAVCDAIFALLRTEATAVCALSEKNWRTSWSACGDGYAGRTKVANVWIGCCAETTEWATVCGGLIGDDV